jgi:hypothetical protein
MVLSCPRVRKEGDKGVRAMREGVMARRMTHEVREVFKSRRVIAASFVNRSFYNIPRDYIKLCPRL